MKKTLKFIGIVFAIIFTLAIVAAMTTPEIEKLETPISTKVTQVPKAEPPKDNLTPEQRNALDAAKRYVNVMAFSRKGLIEQLEFEGYDKSVATFVIDELDIDWDEMAYKCAVSYLNSSSFSRNGLVEQLEFEGFTKEQAEYGVNKAY